VSAEARLRQDPDFRRYWAARTVSFGGSVVTYVVLPVLVYRMTGSGLWTAMVTAGEALPYLCFGLIAGALADRTDRQRLMVRADIISAGLIFTIPAAYLAGVLTPVHVVAVGFAVQTLFVFFDAANFGALPMLARKERLAAATSAVHGTTTVLELSVPVAAGAALAVVAPAPLLAIDGASFVASALLIRAIRAPLNRERESGAARRWGGDIVEGLRFLGSHPVVRVQTVVAVLACVSFGIFNGQLVPWADRALDIGPDDPRLGLLFAAFGLGGLIGSVVFAPLVRVAGEIAVLLTMLPLAAVTAVGVAVSRHWIVAVVAMALWGVPVTVAVLNTVTLRAKVTPDRLQSRVNTAGRMVGFGFGTPVGAFVGGVLSQTSGPTTAMAAVAGALTVAAVVAWASPLRRYRRDPGMVAASE
jgi:predicted MFS family arabinose efflux permease